MFYRKRWEKKVGLQCITNGSVSSRVAVAVGIEQGKQKLKKIGERLADVQTAAKGRKVGYNKPVLGCCHSQQLCDTTPLRTSRSTGSAEGQKLGDAKWNGHRRQWCATNCTPL